MALATSPIAEKATRPEINQELLAKRYAQNGESTWSDVARRVAQHAGVDTGRVQEFYEVVDSEFTVADLREKLLEWERIYNTVRPHQALGYLTPQQYQECYHQHNRKEAMCH